MGDGETGRQGDKGDEETIKKALLLITDSYKHYY
jgi:hypothetical protein